MTPKGEKNLKSYDPDMARIRHGHNRDVDFIQKVKYRT